MYTLSNPCTAYTGNNEVTTENEKGPLIPKSRNSSHLLSRKKAIDLDASGSDSDEQPIK
jgi:hypothetical protein